MCNSSRLRESSSFPQSQKQQHIVLEKMGRATAKPEKYDDVPLGRETLYPMRHGFENYQWLHSAAGEDMRRAQQVPATPRITQNSK